MRDADIADALERLRIERDEREREERLAVEEYERKLDELSAESAGDVDRAAEFYEQRIDTMKAAHAEQLAAVRAEEAEKCGCTWLSPLPPLSP